MIFKDYYKILELETNQVTVNQIKQAYRDQAKKYHPDVNIGDKFAEERFKDISEAYTVLSNNVTRRKYDRMWNNRIGAKKKKQAYEESKRGKDAVFSDFFNLFFGNIEKEEVEKNEKKSKKNVPVKGDNIETAISITFFTNSRRKNENI